MLEVSGHMQGGVISRVDLVDGYCFQTLLSLWS